MRLGGAQSGGDPLAMGAGSDYAELCELQPPRWSSRGYHSGHGTGHPQHPTQTAVSSSSSHIRSNSFEAEDIVGPYGSTVSRIGNSTSSLRGRSGLYYSPPGTSYTIVERPLSPHYYYNTAGAPPKGGSLPGRGTYLGSSATGLSTGGGAGTVPNSTRHNGKKRPISPEQVIRLFGTTSSSSSSVPTSSQYYSNGTRDRAGRRSPASSPPSTTHQIYRDRDRSVPNIHELSTRTVTMSRDQQPESSHGFGICVKGGKDSGIGVYISRIEEGSVAERAGLRPGDTILEVNGTPFTAISHDEALKKCVQILKSSRQISMTVRSPPSLTSSAPLHGFGPPQRESAYPPPYRQTCSWMDRHGRPASPPMEYGGRRHERRDRIRRVELLIEPGQSLGLMIRGGVEYGLGIFITGVDKDSVADRAGLMIGDQILEVNGQSFVEVTHDEAVGQLKYHKRMSLLVRDVGKVPHSCTSVEPEPWDPYSPTGTRSRRKCPISAMVEEKARSLLARHHFASLSYYIAEYGARAMTIDAFVSVLLEMLDTPEKHTLVTEIRELIFPEDRTRYDELVYRRDVYRDSIDRHRRKTDLPHSHELPDYNCDDPTVRRGSGVQIPRSEYDSDQELATKLSRSFDMKEDSGGLMGDKGVRRHQSMQRLSLEQNGSGDPQNPDHCASVVPDQRGNLHITVKKSKPILGIAIEGGANTKHPLPRIINIHEHGAAYEAGGLEVGQLILEVDGHKVEGMHHQEVARLIAECFASREKPDITFLVVEAKKSNMEPKPTALIFLEA
ncbi:whirlin [Lutzomyia longipalpis]|uniref:whirlin n=1 Tax=Lutzomyia longipalpis TaxID=7200 RepID=UPI002483E536|nr:whirlin [Lutzomyia longipalpis]